MTRLYFVRHGESASNVGGVTMEHAAIPLTPRGVAQAAALAELLPAEPSRVLTSQFQRARDTARPFCERTGRQAEIHPLLHEFEMIDPAKLEGMTGEQRRPIADAYWKRGDPHERAGPRAETFAEFEGRVAGFMDELATLPDRCVMFGHGQWIGLLLWKLMGCSARDSQGMKAFRRCQLGLPLSNGVVIVLESADTGRWRWQVDEHTLRQVASVGQTVENQAGLDGLKAAPRLSPDELRKREDAVRFANASIGLEGLTVSAEGRARADRFISGEIDLAEFVQGRQGI